MKALTLFLRTALFSSVLALAACQDSVDKPDLTPVPATAEQQAQTRSTPIFDPATGNIPYPNDVLFAGSQDGTLNIPVSDDTPASDPKHALNALDGFSTSAPITVHFSKSIDVDSLATGVKMVEVTQDMATKAVTGVKKRLTYGVDYVAGLDAEKKTLFILPTKPLTPASGYLVVLTDDIQDVDGQSVQAGLIYHHLKRTSALVDAEGHSVVSGLSDSTATKLEPLRQLTQAQLAVAQAIGMAAEKVALSWSFSTQSIGPVLDTVANPNVIDNTTLQVANTGVTTQLVGGAGLSNLYLGKITLPYYSAVKTEENPTAPLTEHWKGQSGHELTRYTIAQGDQPKKVAEVTVPVLMTVPNDSSGKTMPESGWPVVIFQHGITRNRVDMLAIADVMAQAGYAVIAIDMPLHGITTLSLAGFKVPGTQERTFDMDFVTQNAEGAITAQQPDGVLDSSGRHFIQLSSLLTTRDNLRQAISDLVQLKSALGNAQGVNLDGNNVSFVGHSLGGMVGAGFVKREPDLKAAVIANSGTQAAYILSNSPTFAPEIEAGLQAQGIEPGSPDYQKFILAAQTVVDSGDPVNMVADISVPTLVFEIAGDDTNPSDQVIPNGSTSLPLMGTEGWARIQQLPNIPSSTSLSKGIIRYTQGDHGSLLSSQASPAVTASMRSAMASFIASQGTQVNLGY